MKRFRTVCLCWAASALLAFAAPAPAPAGSTTEARLDSLAAEVAFLAKVLERKGIDLQRERRALALAESTFVFPDHGSPRLGEVTAPVKLVVFLDVQCPYCVRMAPALRDFQSRNAAKVSLEFRHFPLSMHPQAEGAHRALWAAQRQGRFWSYFSRLEARYRDLPDSVLVAEAKADGMDLARFEQDRKSPESERIIERDRSLGLASGVEGTPALYLNGRATRDLSELEAAVSRASR